MCIWLYSLLVKYYNILLTVLEILHIYFHMKSYTKSEETKCMIKKQNTSTVELFALSPVKFTRGIYFMFTFTSYIQCINTLIKHRLNLWMNLRWYEPKWSHLQCFLLNKQKCAYFLTLFKSPRKFTFWREKKVAIR